ncbi:hypothetical protein FRC02_007356 [Tulasnella sp. 418]|nr:hypothetical protein FRC02_007356 [Tulasnella sp. 418]
MTDGTSSNTGDNSGAPPSYSAASPVSLSLIGSSDARSLLISVIPPKEPIKPADDDAQKATPTDIKDNRPPMDFVLTIDVSVSMDSAAPAPGESEPTGLTVLDVVKHAAKTIITTMKDKDRVAIVTFSKDAKVRAPLTQTNAEGKQRVLEIVSQLKSEGNTNLWDGLKTSMNVLTQATPLTDAQGRSTTRLSSIFLLTDGLPNVIPPRGHLPMLKLYLEQHPPSQTNFTINTFGFGYDLDSQLLVNLATLGRGSYSFIPDSGMVGTVFVHAISNTYATFAEGCNVQIEIEEENVVENLKVLGRIKFDKTSWGLQIPLGAIQYSQTRDFVIRFDEDKKPTKPIKVTVKYRPWNSSEEISTSGAITLVEDSSAPVDPRLTYHRYRLLFVAAVSELFPNLDASEQTPQYGYGSVSRHVAFPTQARENFTRLAAGIRKSFSVEGNTPSTAEQDALALAEDIEGQVLMGVGDNAAWTKWGRHYLPSLAGSHLRQQCSNFKDAGLQVYGRDSSLFIACRDEIDTVFDNLPPPEPTYVPDPIDHSPPRYSQVNQQLTGYAAPTAAGAPRGGGGLLQGLFGSRRGRGAASPGASQAASLPPPSESDAHGVFIGGVLCVTLGHGVVNLGGDARSHAFLGDYMKVLKALRGHPIGQTADGVLEAVGVARDAESGLVNGFEWKPTKAQEFRFANEQSCSVDVDHSNSASVAIVA